MYSIYIYVYYIYIHLPCAQANDSSYDGPQKSQFGPGAKSTWLVGQAAHGSLWRAMEWSSSPAQKAMFNHEYNDD